jgi:hypothetical protein
MRTATTSSADLSVFTKSWEEPGSCGQVCQYLDMDAIIRKVLDAGTNLVNIRLTHANSYNSLIYKDSFKVKIHLTRVSH